MGLRGCRGAGGGGDRHPARDRGRRREVPACLAAPPEPPCRDCRTPRGRPRPGSVHPIRAGPRPPSDRRRAARAQPSAPRPGPGATTAAPEGPHRWGWTLGRLACPSTIRPLAGPAVCAAVRATLLEPFLLAPAPGRVLGPLVGWLERRRVPEAALVLVLFVGMATRPPRLLGGAGAGADGARVEDARGRAWPPRRARGRGRPSAPRRRADGRHKGGGPRGPTDAPRSRSRRRVPRRDAERRRLLRGPPRRRRHALLPPRQPLGAAPHPREGAADARRPARRGPLPARCRVLPVARPRHHGAHRPRTRAGRPRRDAGHRLPRPALVGLPAGPLHSTPWIGPIITGVPLVDAPTLPAALVPTLVGGIRTVEGEVLTPSIVGHSSSAPLVVPAAAWMWPSGPLGAPHRGPRRHRAHRGPDRQGPA